MPGTLQNWRLGIAPDGQVGTVTANSDIDPIDAGILETDGATRELITCLQHQPANCEW